MRRQQPPRSELSPCLSTAPWKASSSGTCAAQTPPSTYVGVTAEFNANSSTSSGPQTLSISGLGLDGLGSDARIVDMLSLLLRIALGGLAGIIVGWFWVPTSPTPASSAIEVSSVPFGVAFLAGFSIDSLFALLDRLLKNFQPPSVNKPSPAPRKPKAEA